MRMKIYTILSLLLILACPKASPGSGEKFNPPRLPGATLLIGSADPFFVVLTAPTQIQRLLPEPNQPENRNYTSVNPSISRDGKVVAAARLKVGGYPRRVAIATYSIVERKWTEYAEGEFAGAVAISPDGSKLAFSSSRPWPEGSGDNHLHIIDLKTGKDTLGPEVPGFWRDTASWSPDSRRLAYNFNFEVRVWDADTGKVTKLADGGAVSWSPSGEWIAYFDSPPYERSTTCVIIHPDGSGRKTLFQFPRDGKFQRFLVDAPVWSPDSKTIVLNELDDVDKGTVDIHLLDVSTLKLKTVFKDVLPVEGWAEAK